MRFTRVHYSVIALLVLAYGAVTVMKYGGSSESEVRATERVSTAEQEQIRQFWARYDAATTHRTAGRLEQAATHYAQALEVDPDHEDALYYLGNMQAQLGQPALAETTWTRLTSVNPEGARAYTQLGELHFCARLDVDAARSAYRKALEIHNEETLPLLRLAEIALVEEDWTTAQRYVDAVIGSNYKNAEAYLLNGYLAWRTGASQRATVQLARATRQVQQRAFSQGVFACALDVTMRDLLENASTQRQAARGEYEQLATTLHRLREAIDDAGHSEAIAKR